MRDATLLQANGSTCYNDHFVQMFFPSIRIDPPPLPLLSYSNTSPPHPSIPNITRRRKSNARQCGNNSDLRDSTPFANPKRTASQRCAYTKKKGVGVEREKEKKNSKQQRAHRNAKWKAGGGLQPPAWPRCVWKMPSGFVQFDARCSLEWGNSHDIQKGAAVYADEV